MANRKKFKILVVEDEASLLNTILFTLKRRGFDVEGADEGLVALERLKETTRWQQPFDLMITDIQIPLMDGMHLLEAAKKAGIPTPALVITGHGSAMLKARMEQLGIAGWMDKPFSQDELLTQVRDLVAVKKAKPNENNPRKEGGKP
jgi:two-component system, OmpR family, response regulator TctD